MGLEKEEVVRWRREGKVVREKEENWKEKADFSEEIAHRMYVRDLLIYK